MLSIGYQSFRGIQVTKAESTEEINLEKLQRDGFFVVENVLSQEELKDVRKRMDQLWETQIQKYSEEYLIRINDYGIIRGMMLNDPFFLSLITHPVIENYLKLTVGETAILHLQNGIYLKPSLKHNQLKYHRDFAKDFIASQILSLNAFFLIDSFDAKTGGTWLVPGSHQLEAMPSPSYIESHKIQVNAPAGALLFFDSLLWHCGGENSSAQTRRAINQQYTRPFIKQQLDYPVMMRGRVDLETRLAQRLGLWTIPPKSVEEYRVANPSERTYRGGQG